MASGQKLFSKEGIEEITQGIFSESGIPDTTGTYGTLGAVLGFAANVLVGLGFAFGIASIAYSAVLYVMSDGQPDKTKQAWSAFINGVIAGAIAIGVLVIKTAILSVLGVQNAEITGNQPTF